jgi:hypothetical protein
VLKALTADLNTASAVSGGWAEVPLGRETCVLNGQSPFFIFYHRGPSAGSRNQTVDLKVEG